MEYVNGNRSALPAVTDGDEVLLVSVGCPHDELRRLGQALYDYALIRTIDQLDGLLPPRDTLVIALWSDSVDSLAVGDRAIDLRSIRSPSTRVVGLYLDPDHTSVLADGVTGEFAALSWLRDLSDMVIVSSDVGVVEELVTTLAKSALG